MSTSTETTIERTSLGYTGPDGRGGYSDKVYLVELVKVGDSGYIVNGYNGARTAKNLTKQPKIKTPTTYKLAKAAFDSLVYDKRFNHPRTRYEVEAHWESPKTDPAAAAPKQAATAPAKPRKKTTAPATKPEPEAPQNPPASGDPLGYLDALEL